MRRPRQRPAAARDGTMGPGFRACNEIRCRRWRGEISAKLSAADAAASSFDGAQDEVDLIGRCHEKRILMLSLAWGFCCQVVWMGAVRGVGRICNWSWLCDHPFVRPGGPSLRPDLAVGERRAQTPSRL